MFKRLAVILSFIFVLPVFAGDYDEVFNNGKVFLYLYTNDCSYCVKFNPIYNKVSSIFGNKTCKFLKIDATSSDGRKLMRELNAYYVPYVVMLDNNVHQLKNIVPTCLLNYACTKDAVDKFVN